MSLFRRRAATLDALGVPARGTVGRYGGRVDEKTALAHSAVWAACRLRADLISTLPVDVFRRVAGVDVEVPKPPVVATPDGNPAAVWLWATQFDLDRCGNCFGIITERDGFGLPRRVELVPFDTVSVQVRDGVLDSYRISGQTFDPSQVWHETQYQPAGMPVGLSPVAMAAMSIGGYLSAQQFVQDWFTSGAAPIGRLRNTQKTINADDAANVKARFKAAVTGRDVFVTGADWDYDMIAVPASEAAFIDALNYGVTDVARAFGVPATAIDGSNSGTASVTYSNVTDDTLRFLTHHIGPSVIRREAFLSRLVAEGRRVRFNTDAMLRMDPGKRQDILRSDYLVKLRTNSEVRALNNLPPLTPADIAEFEAIPDPTPTGGTTKSPTTEATP